MKTVTIITPLDSRLATIESPTRKDLPLDLVLSKLKGEPVDLLLYAGHLPMAWPTSQLLAATLGMDAENVVEVPGLHWDHDSEDGEVLETNFGLGPSQVNFAMIGPDLEVVEKLIRVAASIRAETEREIEKRGARNAVVVLKDIIALNVGLELSRSSPPFSTDTIGGLDGHILRWVAGICSTEKIQPSTTTSV